jgi:hypothetical protein
MELIEGEPLSALLARAGRLGLERSLDIVAQAALAVGAAHRVGLVHRDISRATCSCAVTGGEGEATFECALPPAASGSVPPTPGRSRAGACTWSTGWPAAGGSWFELRHDPPRPGA